MSSIVSNDIKSMLSVIDGLNSIEEAIKTIKQIDALKLALESVDAFREQSIKYARLEAEALIKVVELGGANKLRGAHKATAIWLASLSESEKESYIGMCLEGLTIDQIYKREFGRANEKGKQIEYLKEVRQELITELERDGIVDITPFAEQARKAFWDDLSTANDLIDGVRNKVRKAGGVGIGRDTGVYVSVANGRQEEIKKAILLRFESVRRDLEQIKDIAKVSGVKMSYKDFASGSYALENSPELIHILVWLSRIELVDESVYDRITQADCRREMDYVCKALNLSREEYIRNQYHHLSTRQTI